MTKVCRIMSIVGIVLLLGISTPAAPLVSSIMPLTTAEGRTFCTAFSIARDEHLWVTAGHCIAFALENQVDMRIGGFWAIPIYAMFSPTTDWAVIQSGAFAPALHLADSTPKVGDSVEIKGFPYGVGELVTVKGFVGARQVPPLGPYPISDILDITVAPGNSGSPVLKKGHVVGLLWGRFNDSEHSLSIPWEALRQHLSPYWGQS